MSSLLEVSQSLGHLLGQKGLSLATAESCTGGAVAQAITAVAGSSAWYMGGVVAYDNSVKRRVLNVSPSSLDHEGAVSEVVARQMATGAAALCGARISVATTGVAGPGGGSPSKPVGTVWVAWYLDGNVDAVKYVFVGNRHDIQASATRAALEGLAERLKK
jgi:nicotinamide-nucleotide amidase